MNADDKFKPTVTFRHVVKHFSTLEAASRSDVYYARGLPWRIEFVPQNIGGLYSSGLFLVCDAGPDLHSLACSVVGVLRIISQKEGVSNVEQEIEHWFAEPWFTCRDFDMPWDDIYDSDKGYVKDDVVVFEASFTVDVSVRSGILRGQFQREVEGIRSCNSYYSVFDRSRVLFPNRALFPSVIDPALVGSSWDVLTLVCQDKSFNCHRNILAQASAYFDKMFNGGYAEANDTRLVIKDDKFSGETMLEVLRFIYCGYVEANLSQATPEEQHEFLYAAEKFQLKGLTHLVTLAIEETLDGSNVCKYLMYVERFSLTTLKVLCFTVMAERANRVVVWTSPEFVEFCGDKKLVEEFDSFDA